MKPEDGLDADASLGTQVIRRTAVLLRLLTAHNRIGMRLVDLYRGAGIQRSTAHRLLQGLVAERLVTQHQQSKRYFLGLAIYEMGLAAAPPLQLRDLCQPHLLAVAEQTGDTVFLSVRSGFDGVCIDRKEGAFPIKAFVLEPGRRRPLSVGSGNIAILSGLPDDEITRICAANQARVTERYPRYSDAEFERRLGEVRRTGYALTDVLETVGVRAVAMRIRDASGEAFAAISVSTLNSRLEGERVREVVTYLADAVAAVEAELANAGYRSATAAH